MAQDNHEHTYFKSWTLGGFVHGDLETRVDLTSRNLKI